MLNEFFELKIINRIVQVSYEQTSVIFFPGIPIGVSTLTSSTVASALLLVIATIVIPLHSLTLFLQLRKFFRLVNPQSRSLQIFTYLVENQLMFFSYIENHSLGISKHSHSLHVINDVLGVKVLENVPDVAFASNFPFSLNDISDIVFYRAQ